MEKRQIADGISYLPAVETPLSADVGLVQCEDAWWVFDVGSLPEAAEAVNALPGRKNVVLSHFHQDHSANLDRVAWDCLYGGGFTCRRLGRGTAVTASRCFDGGVHLFPIPSSHAKGCLGLEYHGYAFLGDALYLSRKDGRVAANVSLLNQQILFLKTLRADWFLLSHGEPFVRPKAEVLAWLESIYAQRNGQEPFLYLT